LYNQSKVITGDSKNPFVIPFNKTIEVLLINTDVGHHPFHLHGHAVHIISTSFVPNGEILYLGKYTRRDVVTLPPGGWLRFRFQSDNPGIWIFHCHIDWHMRAGMAAEFI